MGKTIIGNTAMVNIMSWPRDCYLEEKKNLNPVFIRMYACSHTLLFQKSLYQNSLVS